MNFKPSLLKLIISLASSIFINYYLSRNYMIQCLMPLQGGVCNQPTWLEHAFDIGPLSISVLTIIFVYVIWSLFQKKN